MFAVLLKKFPAYGSNLLLQSLRYKPTRHRPYVWRLLASIVGVLEVNEDLLMMAQRDAAENSDAVLRREARRFLKLVRDSTEETSK